MDLQKMTVEQLKIAYALAANSPEDKHQEIADSIYAEYKNRMEPTQGKCIAGILTGQSNQSLNL